MKVLTVVTPPHRLYLDKYFLPTFPWDSNTDLIISQLPHVCPTGIFGEPGFNEVCRLKLQKVNEMCMRFANEVILYCDVDIMFYTNDITGPVMEALGDKDFAFINEGNNQYGCGCFAVQANCQVRDFLKELDGHVADCRDDQEALNLHIHEVKNITHGFLPDKFFGIGKDFGYWPRHRTDKPITLPDNMVLHHGNFAVGLNHKTNLLNYVNEMWQLNNG